ncbi:hypothetical protein C5167_020190 [Papaver somniferum]|uniref:DUF7787 domain-containing protein n=1 Tax=Papaver somniferum TaxID=3469 RepID=A0A4Y7ISA9_PAPSO|nr:uncharacterized protein LOC113349505 [Papaver somniferum]RZC51764.1 hypothetical protein C5167_020190 [Papaver somniferum]
MVGVSKRLSIEDYADFFQNPQQHYLNKQHLNQILSMHGYPTLKVPRADLMEELKTLTMESPFRSTLREKNTSASASLLNPDEIKKDLATIRWNEWSIDSVQIHRSGVSSPVEEERQYSVKFVNSAEKSSKTKRQGLTDISNLPAAANLNSSNSKQVQPKKKKKISPDSDTPAATTVQGLTDITNLPSAPNPNSSNSKQVQVQPKKKKISPDSGTPAATTVQGLTDISNLPSAPNLNSSNSKQVKPKKKKISPDSDMGGKRKKTISGALDWLSSRLVVSSTEMKSHGSDVL